MTQSFSFDALDDSGKRVLAVAQDEAIQMNHNYIGTEHLLLGLIRGDTDGPAGRSLARLGIALDKARTALRFIVGQGDAAVGPSEITMSPRTKKVLELAMDEAAQLGHAKAGAAEICLALIREGQGIASGIIESLGVTLVAARSAVLAELAGQPAPPPGPGPYPRRQHASGPFDRFNDRAKRVLALAQDEAIRLGHSYIGPEHLLLGLVREGEGAAARAFDALGVDLSKLRSYVEVNVGRGPAERPSEMTLSARMKNIIELAVDEARRLGHSHVGTEHLALGIVRDGEGVAAAALGSLGVSLEKLGHQLIATIGAQSIATTPSRHVVDAPAPPLDPVLSLAAEEARTLGHDWLGSEHILLGLLRTEAAASLLGALGVSYSEARAAVVKAVPQRAISAANITVTPRAHAIIGYANGHAHARGVPFGPESLLLALSADGEGIGAQILTSLGASADKVRDALERRPPPS